jgi:phosphate starvation-inducible PhoH-like protein
MRGRTFENAWIIADEAQNMTPNQMLMLLTRIGNKSKMIITGDPRQHDRGFEKNGLTDFLVRLEAGAQHMGPMEEIKIVEFTAQDVERHPVIRKILKLYD